jgi:hypothetical protein
LEKVVQAQAATIMELEERLAQRASVRDLEEVTERLRIVDKATFEAVASLQEQMAELENKLENGAAAPTNIPPGTTWCSSCRQAKIWGRLGCPSTCCLQRRTKQAA